MYIWLISHPFINLTLAWLFSCKFAVYFQNSFSSEHLWRPSFGNWKIACWKPWQTIQLTNTCSKSTLEALEKDVILPSLPSFWCFYCWLLTYFTPFSSVSIVDFDKVNVNWALFMNTTSLQSDAFFTILIFLNFPFLVIVENPLPYLLALRYKSLVGNLLNTEQLL